MAGRAPTHLRAIVGSLGALAAMACGAAACGLDANGLRDAPLDGSSMTSSTPLGDATASTSDGSTGVTPLAEDGSTVGVQDATTAIDGTSPPGSPVPPLDDAGPSDAEEPDVRVLDPDASYADASDPCDLDQDGYKSAEGDCGGDDCCDYDSRANPGDTSYYTATDACGSFDYDCNGKDDPEYAKVSCSLGFFTCNGSGFDQSPPPCGESALFDNCNYFVACYTTQDTTTEACR